jgi:WD repeat-containing protein 61
LLYQAPFNIIVETWGVTFSPDGRFVASTGQSGNVNLWNIETGKKEQVFQTNGKFTVSVAWSGNHIACGALDGVVTIFDVAENKRLHSIEGKT